ncbi:MAG: hypothetical protein KDB27_21335 [Planctomycetales bacterium]|nr:hypothetical protein [Planctomycetales bacterium]
MSGVYRFEESEQGFAVYVRGKCIGEIVPAKEASGRHCFFLACDDRREPRTYRGKQKAAEALHAIYKLKSDSTKKRWSREKLIVMAWDERPRASELA